VRGLEHGSRITRSWPGEGQIAEHVLSPRDDIVRERTDGAGRFVQEEGPFLDYERTVTRDGDGATIEEQTSYRFALPWFGWLFALPIRWAIARRGHDPAGGRPLTHRTPAWAPPDRLTPRQLNVLGLLAASSMASAFINTLFTQTVEFAADDFGVGDSGIGIAGAVVRAGIVFVLPVAVLADRIGRRSVIVVIGFAAPLVAAAGALAPTFPVLVATQTIGRPLGLALDFLVAVVAAEEMPRNSRAYAVSVLAMASGLGAGIAVASLPLADLGSGGWRLVYVVTLIWLFVAVSIFRRLPETVRFQRKHVASPPIDRRRFGVLAAVAVLGNLFVAPASLFQNGYLEDERGYSAALIAAFTLATATPAGIGLIVGGRIADIRGRRRVIAVCVPTAATLLVISFSVGGPPMWLSAMLGGIVGAIAFPALAVYRNELFPTGSRSKASALITAAALLGGIVGLVVMGALLDRGRSHGSVLGGLAIAQLAVVTIVLLWYPETAHRELEELNPIDRPAGQTGLVS
jgi:MFS family permease